MWVRCDICQRNYDDVECWTICPHGPLWAAHAAYCRKHDLVNCAICHPRDAIEADLKSSNTPLRASRRHIIDDYVTEGATPPPSLVRYWWQRIRHLFT